MPGTEFTPLTQVLQKSYCDELLKEGVMPAAVVCLEQADTSNVFSVITRNRLSGLPVIDLARLESDEAPEHYVSHRLRKRFEFRLPEGTLQLIPVRSNTSPHVKDIGNSMYPGLHKRIYFPVVGRTDVVPGRDTIRAVSREEVLNDIVAPQGGDTLYQLIDIHRELLYDYHW